jgi:hypothetical protein
MMTDKTFDAVLAQYEQNTKPFGNQPNMSQEDRMNIIMRQCSSLTRRKAPRKCMPTSHTSMVLVHNNEKEHVARTS